MHTRFCLALLAVVLLGFACSRAVDSPYFAGFQVPQRWPAPVYPLANNPVTQPGFVLGRTLFYDPALSVDNSISCGSCHQQSSGFTQHGHAVSHGVQDRLGRRNSPPIMNLAWDRFFGWDGGVFELDLFALHPINAFEEMNFSMPGVVARLQQSNRYQKLFSEAYGNSEINSTKVLKALSQFMLLCNSSQSRYDSVANGNARFTELEQAGYTLYRNQCSSCHTEPLFHNAGFASNGLPPTQDKGRYEITGLAADRYQFKIPSLRNLRYTAPYMHDGRFLNLDAVLDHYQNRVDASAQPSPALQNGIALNARERMAIKAFLETLNDASFTSNPLLAEQ